MKVVNWHCIVRSVAATGALTFPDNFYLFGVGCAIVTDESYLPDLGATRLATVLAAGATADSILDRLARPTAVLHVIFRELFLAARRTCRSSCANNQVIFSRGNFYE